MAETYREIQTTETDSGSPLTAELAEAWRANWIAGAEGAAGAPRIEADAMQGSVAGSGTLFSALGDGNNIDTQTDEFPAPPSFRAYTTCEIRVFLRVEKSGAATGDPDVIVYKNGTIVLQQAVTTTRADHQIDVSLVAGDVVNFEGTTIIDGGGTSGVQFFIAEFKTGSQRSVGGT